MRELSTSAIFELLHPLLNNHIKYILMLRTYFVSSYDEYHLLLFLSLMYQIYLCVRFSFLWYLCVRWARAIIPFWYLIRPCPLASCGGNEQQPRQMFLFLFLARKHSTAQKNEIFSWSVIKAAVAKSIKSINCKMSMVWQMYMCKRVDRL